MEVERIYAIRNYKAKLKSLYIQLREHEKFNPYGSNVISSMPKGNGTGRSMAEWYVEEKERLELEIRSTLQMIDYAEGEVDDIINHAPYPESAIIRFRVKNNMSWNEIAREVFMDRRNASRKFYNYIENLPIMPTMPTQSVL